MVDARLLEASRLSFANGQKELIIFFKCRFSNTNQTVKLNFIDVSQNAS